MFRYRLNAEPRKIWFFLSIVLYVHNQNEKQKCCLSVCINKQDRRKLKICQRWQDAKVGEQISIKDSDHGKKHTERILHHIAQIEQARQQNCCEISPHFDFKSEGSFCSNLFATAIGGTICAMWRKQDMFSLFHFKVGAPHRCFFLSCSFWYR